MTPIIYLFQKEEKYELLFPLSFSLSLSLSLFFHSLDYVVFMAWLEKSAYNLIIVYCSLYYFKQKIKADLLLHVWFASNLLKSWCGRGLANPFLWAYKDLTCWLPASEGNLQLVCWSWYTLGHIGCLASATSLSDLQSLPWE